MLITKKKRVWEMVASRVRSESGLSGCLVRAEQWEGKWKALTLAFRKCEDHNSRNRQRKERILYIGTTSSRYLATILTAGLRCLKKPLISK